MSKFITLFQKKGFREIKLVNYFISLISISLISLLCLQIQHIIGYQSVALILLLTLTILPLFLGFGPVMLAASMSALLWNFLFIPPKFTLYIEELEDFLMFIMYFIIAITTGVLTTRIREHETLVVQREKKTIALYALTKDLSASNSLESVIESSIRHLKEFFNSDILFIKLDRERHILSSIDLKKEYLEIINNFFEGKVKANRYLYKYEKEEISFYPIFTTRKILGVIGIKLKDKKTINLEQETLLENFIYQIASALEREFLNDKAKESMVLTESDRLYKTLFNSISHELRTPIATIMGATSSLIDEKTSSIPEVRKELTQEIYLAGERLNRLVGNLLDMSRLESGKLQLNLDWHDINDLISKVLSELRKKSYRHIINLDLADDLPLIKIDFVLLEQAIFNIVINSLNYTNEGSIIKIRTYSNDSYLFIEILDNGSGLPNDLVDKIFEKFYRLPGTKTGGTGLGLSISKGFVEAHKGIIKVVNLQNQGLKFTISLPITENNQGISNE